MAVGWKQRRWKFDDGAHYPFILPFPRHLAPHFHTANKLNRFIHILNECRHERVNVRISLSDGFHFIPMELGKRCRSFPFRFRAEKEREEIITVIIQLQQQQQRQQQQQQQ